MKAEITLPSGARVVVEGSKDEVEYLVDTYSREASVSKEDRPKRPPTSENESDAGGPRGYVRQLKREGYFKTKQTLKTVQEKLAERGHIYPQSTLSAALLMLTRRGELGRMKESGSWVYVQR